MPGIVVGVDGSGHSRKAMERAAAEAAAHGVPLTVLVIHQAVRDVYGSASHYGDDAALTEKAKEAAQADTDQVLAAAGSQPTVLSGPASSDTDGSTRPTASGCATGRTSC